ncbi:MAG: hypothetical protein QOG20_5360 [Pseudonocardiales bacterium]|jgi:hypothetical protein|uniref:serine protease n=1 Tax=Pseudonocardia sp. TaxID=60912 RepID=UPI0026346364|nr:serine protease [Pseudonocardia sp.]MCW2718969.1 Serine protease [Pseudonocardia sp.]MDT7614024.1 hypothetical protein [Pseudonocardiales bacterium]MDT7709753.1 hypothetical protein [Pseudonocardiales bacterium]
MVLRVRGVVAAAATVGVVGIAALFAPSATAATVLRAAPAPAQAPGGWAPADSAPIRPGVLTETAGGGACTANFVFTSGNRVFLGQAAHCGGTGQSTETNGCDSGTVPLGAAVTIKGADGRDRTGTMVYSSWVTMQADGESDPDTCAYNDLALVEIAPGDVPDVNPSIPFFGGPTGIDSDGLAPGEQVYSYGNSPLRLGISALSPKVGVSAGDIGNGHSHVVYTLSPGVPGDSGSAYLDAKGAAVGQLSTLNLSPLPVSNGVGDIAGELQYANAAGGLGDVELVLGTKPFDPTPAGVSPQQLAAPAGPPLGAS